MPASVEREARPRARRSRAAAAVAATGPLRVLFKSPSGARARRVKLGFAWDLFLFAGLLGVPLFLRGLPEWGAAVLALWLVDLALGWIGHGSFYLPAQTALFAAFLGFNPIQTEVPHHILAALGPVRANYLTGRSFFPKLISSSFQQGLRLAFDFAAALTIFAAVASWLRGSKYIHSTESIADDVGTGLLDVGDLASAEIGAGSVIDS